MAGFDAAAADYRESALAAFQQVEDNLAALRILEDEVTREKSASGQPMFGAAFPS